MTTDDKRPDPRVSDPDIDAAWRTLPRDEPPPALDTAIRAAARRAVGAGPERVRQATRPERWWWPLAAAATIGAVTIGILQLGGPERRDSMRSEPAVVSDMAPQPESGGQKPVPEGQTVQPPSPPPSTPPPRAPVAPKPRGDGVRDATALAPAAPTRKDAASADTAALAPAPPAAAPQASTRREAAANESRAQDAGRIERAPEQSAARADEQRAPAANPFPAGSPSAPSPDAMPSAPSVPPYTRRPDARMREPFPAGGAAPTASRETSASPLATADWIALIRRLRAEGRIDEAARELAAFRAVHPDHARELPPDLRDWRPSDPAAATPAPR